MTRIGGPLLTGRNPYVIKPWEKRQERSELTLRGKINPTPVQNSMNSK